MRKNPPNCAKKGIEMPVWSKKKKALILGGVPGLGLGEGDDHTLELGGEHDLAPEAGVLVEDAVAGGAGEDVALLVRWRGELLEPLLGDVHLALGRARVDLLQAVRRGIDEPRVRERAQEGLPGEPHHLAPVPVGVDREELHDAIRDLGWAGGDGGGRRDGGGGGGAGPGEYWRAGEVEGEATKCRDRHC